MYKIIANWKMYLDIQESRNLAAQLANWWTRTADSGGEFVVCPSALAIHDVRQQLDGSTIKLGIQELSVSIAMGAFTGQIPGKHLQELDIDYAILGHSEMRQFYGVTDEFVSAQLRVALIHNVTPIICIGETLEQRKKGITDQVIQQQIMTIFSGIDTHHHEICIAYEPRWAIGSGTPVDVAEAQRVHKHIVQVLKDHSSTDISRTHVLYGGSVNASNLQDFLTEPSIDGVLIGSASAKPETLEQLIQAFEEMLS